MSRSRAPTLLPLVQSFFRDHLERMCGASPHTIRAYRDTLRMLFNYLADQNGRSVADLRLEDLDVEAIRTYLKIAEAV